MQIRQGVKTGKRMLADLLATEQHSNRIALPSSGAFVDRQRVVSALPPPCTRRLVQLTKGRCLTPVANSRNEPLEVRFDKVVTLCEIAPQRVVVYHRRFPWLHCSAESGRRYAEPFGQLRPQPVPTEEVAIDDIEGLFAGSVSVRGLHKLSGKHACIGKGHGRTYCTL